MKKLEKIDFAKCDVLVEKQLNCLKGGSESTHQDVCNTYTGCNNDIAYVITWDSGAKSMGIYCLDAVDPE